MHLFLLEVKQPLFVKHDVVVYDFIKAAERAHLLVYGAVISKDFQHYCLK